jgi:hypothetical protein
MTYDHWKTTNPADEFGESAEQPPPVWLSGKPYDCETCGLGMAEYLACEDGGCKLESEDAAQLRRDTAVALQHRSALGE